MTIEAIIFDKDGTLFDFAATWSAFARALIERISEGDTSRAERIGARLGFELETGTFAPDSVVIAATPAEIAEVLYPELPRMSSAEIVDMLNDEAERAPQVEAVELVTFLSDLRTRGLRLGVATNDAEAPALAHLGAAGVQDRFDFIAGFDSGYGAKPLPGQLLAFADHVGIAPERVAMVGDSLHDLLAGRAAGMRTIGVLTGIAREADLSAHADVVLPHIGHIPSWLEAIRPSSEISGL
ncbi:HAD family hydrolase [Lutimaribacter marinistellae]|uniref:phosphoglycolate phosphatase n=1 Tax=Lutimaribacter marinistellae TaxID=1820329 RepID=A0ABV7TJP5_9RHOB